MRIRAAVSNFAHQNVWVAAAGGCSLYNEFAYISDRKNIIPKAVWMERVEPPTTPSASGSGAASSTRTSSCTATVMASL